MDSSMTGELKPCPFCGGDPSSKFSDMKASIWCDPCDFKMEFATGMISLRVAEKHQRKIAIKRWNARAVPDVPELVRYDFSQHNMIKATEGYWVKHHEAAAMLTAKDKDIAGWKEVAGSYANKFADAALNKKTAEAELAQIKAQKLVGSYEIESGEVVSTTDFYDDKFPYPDGDLLLYAAPVDQTAEIECLREALILARTWHEGADKAISKQPNANTGQNGWMRCEHQEQIELINAALAGKVSS